MTGAGLGDKLYAYRGADVADLALIERVGNQRLIPELSDLTVESLGCMTTTHGIEVATAAAYACLRKSARHGGLIGQIDAGEVSVGEDPPTLLIVPGAFHRHHGNTGADGQRVVSQAHELGWPVERVNVPSLGPLAANARALIEHLAKTRARRIVVVSLSKGSSDVAFALAHHSDGFGSVVGWLDLSGLVLGTPLIPWLRSQRIRCMGAHLLLWTKGLRFSPLDELARSPAGPLAAPPPLPPHVRAVHVLGFPLRKHLRHPWAPNGYSRLERIGPNDGGGILLGDAARLPGLVYPVWGADHYLNPDWNLVPVLRSLLLHVSASAATASAIPATKSSA